MPNTIRDAILTSAGTARPARWRRTLTAGAVTTGVVLVASVAACSGGGNLTYAETDLLRPEAFLTDIESKWAEDPEDARPNRHDDARCYFTEREGNPDIDLRVFCGPIRYFVEPDHAEQDADDDGPPLPGPGLWDSYEIAVEPRPDEGYLLVDPGTDPARGVDLPSGVELVRPDGSGPPDDADKLAVPPPPPAEPGYIGQFPELEVIDTATPKDGTLLTAEYTLTVEEVGVVETIRPATRTRSPAEGEEFLAAKVRQSFDGPHAGHVKFQGIETDVEYAIDIDGERLDPGLLRSEDSSVWLLASVPKNSDPQLVMAVGDAEQTVSLRTGERTSTTLAGFYGHAPTVDVAESYGPESFTDGGFELTFSTELGGAILSGFDPERGYAEEGRAWLHLDAESTSAEFGTMTDYDQVVFDTARSFTVVTADGEKTTNVTDPIGWEGYTLVGNGRYRYVFDVPADATEFKVTFEPTFDYEPEESPSGTRSLPSTEFALNFGE